MIGGVSVMRRTEAFPNVQGMGPDVAGSCAKPRPMRAEQPRDCVAYQPLVSVTLSHWPQRTAEAGADGRCACPESDLRVGHSSHQLRDLGAITNRGQANRKILRHRMQNRHCPLSVLPLCIVCFAYQANMVFPRSRHAAKFFYTAHICCGKSLWQKLAESSWNKTTAVSHLRSAGCSS